MLGASQDFQQDFNQLFSTDMCDAQSVHRWYTLYGEP